MALLRDFFREFYEPRRLLGRSPSTSRQYYMLFNSLERYLDRPPRTADLDTSIVAGFLHWLNTTTVSAADLRRRAPRTINKARDQLLALSNAAVRWGKLKQVPDVAPLPEPRRLPKAYTVEQVALLLEACRNTPGLIAGLPAGSYWYAIGQVHYWTGLRPGAVWSVLRCDVSLERLEITVQPEAQKHRAEQLFQVHADCIDAIRAIWQPERERLFPWPWEPPARYAHWNKILRRAGLPLISRNKFKLLRKTCATLLKANGGDPTAQLGHSTDAVTRRNYLVPDLSRQAGHLLPRPCLPRGNGQLFFPTF